MRLQDVARLTAIPGIGKKTAERISLELKDRLPSTTAVPGQAAAGNGEDQLRTDLLSALLNLGYPRAAADKAIEKGTSQGTPVNFEQALKNTLRILMRT